MIVPRRGNPHNKWPSESSKETTKPSYTDIYDYHCPTARIFAVLLLPSLRKLFSPPPFISRILHNYESFLEIIPPQLCQLSNFSFRITRWISILLLDDSLDFIFTKTQNSKVSKFHFQIHIKKNSRNVRKNFLEINQSAPYNQGEKKTRTHNHR